jgi:serine/threonine-protein kinase
MGVVYEVEHDVTGDRLALKVLKGDLADIDPVVLERFRNEARVAARVKSDHIVRVIDADIAPELSGAPFMVMDLLEGANLADTAGDEPQPPERVVDWLSQVARALDKAHAVGIIHRDLKPENLFLAQRPVGDPIIKILDFGVAKIRTDQDRSHTVSGTVVGTPLYMAPEQAEGASNRIGPGTDMWSVGLLAFRLLTGRDYWTATNVSLLLVDIIRGPIKPPSARGARLGQAFDAWFLRSCARQPAARWGTVEEQVEALASSLGVDVPAIRSGIDSGRREARDRTSAPRISPNTPVTRSMRDVVMNAPSRTRRVAVIVVGVLVVLVTGAFLARNEQRRPAAALPTTTSKLELGERNKDPNESFAPISPPSSSSGDTPAAIASEPASLAKPAPPAEVAAPQVVSRPIPRPRSSAPTPALKTQVVTPAAPTRDPLADPK